MRLFLSIDQVKSATVVQMANLIKTIQAEGTFTAFSRALEMTELVTVLREPGAYTVFAPTDAAFAQMKAEARDDLFDNYYDLSKVIKYHVVMGVYKAAALLDVMFLKTMEGQRLAIRSSTSKERTSEKLDDGSDAHSYVIGDFYLKSWHDMSFSSIRLRPEGKGLTT
jgi:uncharacterized surface protein with fasciclin (FAS1) repeats